MSKTKNSKSHSSSVQKKKKQLRSEQRTRARVKKRYSIISLAVLGTVVLGGLAMYAVQQNRRPLQDLSGIGQGIPAIVQVFDPTCPVCSELRENINLIEKDFPDDVLLIRVADISSEEGLAFIKPHTTNRRVTLLFFDGEGKLVDTQVGLQTSGALRLAFQAHVKS